MRLSTATPKNGGTISAIKTAGGSSIAYNKSNRLLMNNGY